MSNSEQEANWQLVGPADDIEEEDVMQFDFGDESFAIYHTIDGFYATDGFCTHEQQHLAEGIVIDNIIECPLHQGRFDVRTGEAKSAPVCVDLKTWPVQIRNGNIYIQLDGFIPATGQISQS
jgi:3-phenylpropionate/trans-cinnamate dioxygenase ferredoxin subunit